MDQPDSPAAAIARLLGMSVPEMGRDFDGFAADLRVLLSASPGATCGWADWLAAVRHAYSYFYSTWDPRGRALAAPVTDAILARAGQPDEDISALLTLMDMLYFFVWYVEASNVEQCRAALPGFRATAGALARQARAALPPSQGRPRICLLCQYVERDNPITLSSLFLVKALLQLPGGCELSIVAWNFAHADLLHELAADGLTVERVEGTEPADTLVRVEAAIARISPDILITDMNTAVPIAVFARRAAPVQVFLQAGMPAFPETGLDAVFDSFGFGAAEGGWGAARMLPFRPPWKLQGPSRPVLDEEVEAERRLLPQAAPLFGMYGRLVKVTTPYLESVERILIDVPTAHFVAGGVGDPSVALAFAQASPVGARMHVQARYVPGHAWGRILDLFLDTWPLTGGESVRECMSKGLPVVALHSGEMPALDDQRDPALLAQDRDGFCDLAVRLLRDRDARMIAGRNALAFAGRMADPLAFRADIAGAVSDLLADARRRAEFAE